MYILLLLISNRSLHPSLILAFESVSYPSSIVGGKRSGSGSASFADYVQFFAA